MPLPTLNVPSAARPKWSAASGPSSSFATWPKGLVGFASWSARWRESVPRTLSLRLRALEEEGIVERHTFPEVPPRVEYALTEKGEALVPLVEDMRRYGTRWLFEDAAAEPAPATV